MSPNTEYALAQAVGPDPPQNHEAQTNQLAALEAHDADIPTAHQASSGLKGAHAVAGQVVSSSHHQAAPPTSSTSEAADSANAYPNPPTLNDARTDSVDQEQADPADCKLAPSTVAQRAPSRHKETTPPTAPVVSPSALPETAPSSAPEVLQSSDPENPISTLAGRATSTAPEAMHTVAKGQASPASSELDKEVDLETGNRCSSSSSKTEVEATEQAVADPNIVSWDGADDPQNPMNWSPKVKWANVAVIASITFLTPLASSMFAPGVPQMMREFDSTNQELGSFVVSIYVLGYAFGPLLIAPLSELYGRLHIYHVCNVLFVIFTIACALATNLNMLIGFRFIEGLFGSCPLTIGGGTIADMIPQQERGGVMAIWALGPLMGPVIGPVAGGYLSQAKGWRWVFWVIAMAGGVISISAFFFLSETYAPIVLERKAAKLRKATGNTNLTSKLKSPLTPTALFKVSIVRPIRMLIFSPIVLALSIYMAVVYGYLYLLFTTITEVYENQYQFSQGSVGLTFLGIGIGSLVGVITFGIASDRIVKAKSKNGEMKPEYRLPPMMVGSFIVPIGLFLYGWTAEKHVFWIVPIIGTGLVGLGLLATFMPIQTYLVDAFTVYAASALAANTVLRSLLGALLPLAGQKMYATLGLGWGNSLLAFIALAMCPIPWIFYSYGERIRKSPRFQQNW